MKKATLYWLIFIVLVNLFLIGTSNAQDFGNLNVIDGSRSAFDTPINVSPVLSHRFTDIACKELNFWTVGIQGEILQWELSGNAVTFTDTIFQSSPVVSLAYADNLNSGSITRTFYGSNFYHGSDLYYYDGAIWDTLPFPSGPGTPNAGGYHSYLYYQALVYSSGLDAIIRFDGVSEDTIFILPAPQNFSIAEIAVDAQGNIWTMEGTQGIQSDSVIVISPSGTILQTFALNMSTLHAYGCFLLNDVFYIVFGSGNPQYPSSVVQI
ncbi:MAG TPA: hypothetical protein PLU53_13870, partial [Bacteroidia bacterium]|nr:hypothetical protein [Bacteroidia bacterium]